MSGAVIEYVAGMLNPRMGAKWASPYTEDPRRKDVIACEKFDEGERIQQTFVLGRVEQGAQILEDLHKPACRIEIERSVARARLAIFYRLYATYGPLERAQSKTE